MMLFYLGMLIYLLKYSQQSVESHVEKRSVRLQQTTMFEGSSVKQQPNMDPGLFKRVLNVEQKKQLIESLRLLRDTLDNIGIAYMIEGGSLIGSWRHHGIIPWDDDIDMLFNGSMVDKFKQIDVKGHKLAPTNPKQSFTSYKFFNNRGWATSNDNWKWPFLDLFPFCENETHLFICDQDSWPNNCWPKKDVLPFKLRPFEELMVKAPKNTEKVLSTNYNIHECLSPYWSHRWENYTEIYKFADCTMLRKFYPFVIRSENWHIGDAEELYLDGKLVNTVNPS